MTVTVDDLLSRAEHFWSRVDRGGGAAACWSWTGATNRQGYGILGLTVRSKHRTWLAHRMAYAVSRGVLLYPFQKVCHRCDNPPCCNPSHLWSGSQSENVTDMVTKGRLRDNSGVRNPRARLDLEKAAAIRKRYGDGRAESQWDIARAYGVSQTQVSKVVRGLIWVDAVED